MTRLEPAKRIVIATAPFGNGHTAAARAIADALRSTWPKAAVDIIDVAAGLYRKIPLGSGMRRFYRCASTKWNGVLHRAIYWAFDRLPAPLARCTDLLWGRRIFRAIRRPGEPDLVVATYSTIGFILRRRMPPTVPVVNYVTDAGRANRIWFEGSVDAYLVIDEAVAHRAASCGVDRSRIHVVGLPTPLPRLPMPTKKQARDLLGIAEHEFVVLFTAGGAGLGSGVLRTAQLIIGHGLDVFAILNAGDNARLYRCFRELAAKGRGLATELIEDLSVPLIACDLVVGKAGMMTLAEATAAGRPTLIVDVIPGQESGNARLAVDIGSALITSPEDAVRRVAGYLGSRTLIDEHFAVERARCQLDGWASRCTDSLAEVAAWQQTRATTPMS
ncbi:hypothetical protein O7632_28685 [Solwaraspora sp. WMMD406]|uniref:MGDG synthase family glycosyltransferase n=1 Tax=Solwaraspora sp. WMMD406 TaxID=3016095 RepID=UPI002415E085|nr:hypothetical protein [Solwaraspora sp. WMMD406]MDG4768038.1 hypothetical protein [Solwaraspora sp. WMMD406]